MNTTDRKILEIALGLSEPLPLPNSLAEEIALVERKLAAEGDIADPILDHLPAYRSDAEVSRIDAILDSLEQEGRNR